MKKIFTLVLLAMTVFAVQAETVADYERGIGTFTAGGTCNLAGTVKIHLNTDAINGIQFANSYTSEGVINANYTTVTCEGGFKAGDVISIAGAFNNSDNSKQSAIDIFVPNEDNTANVLFTTQQFINGRSSADDPVVETYTLEEDIDVLYLGRNGNTSTFITVFKVVRGEETPIEPEVEPEPEEGVIFDGGMIAQNKDKEWIDKFGTIEFFGTCSYDGVKVHENVDNLPCILFEHILLHDGVFAAGTSVDERLRGEELRHVVLLVEREGYHGSRLRFVAVVESTGNRNLVASLETAFHIRMHDDVGVQLVVALIALLEEDARQACRVRMNQHAIIRASAKELDGAELVDPFLVLILISAPSYRCG